MWNPFRPKSPENVTLEAQLATLASCGITLAPGLSPEALTVSFTREQFEGEPFRLLLTAMGGEPETDAQATPSGYLSDNIWHFDTECIEDHGAYVVIASRLSILAQGELPLDQIEDYVDIEEGKAWVAFELRGHAYRWDAKVEDDWVDPTILTRFANLLDKEGGSRRYTYIDLGGQDCLIGCATSAERSAFQQRTGLKVDWLS